MDYITMNRKEREQSKVFAQVKAGTMSQVEAAAQLRVSARWVRKKFKRYVEYDDFGLVHKSRGKASPRRWDKEKEKLLIELLKGEWHGFGPTFAAEKLKEHHEITVSREVVRKAMVRANLWEPKKKRGKHRKRRERKSMVGIMVQLDGSPHDWFEGRGETCTLLVFIDDATSQILWLEFANAESVMALMKATKNYVEKHGRPQSFYTDFGSVFHVNLNNPEGEKKTQWERACKELGIEVHHAHSPQAKGRVERCNQTMQDRLIKEMRLAGVSSMEAANTYLQTSNFIQAHNAKFAVPPLQQGNAHASVESYNLEDIFSVNETRILAQDYTIMFNKRIFQLGPQQQTLIRPKNEIIVKMHLNGTVKLWIRRTELHFTEIYSRPQQQVCAKEKIVSYVYKKPSQNSRRWVAGLPPAESRVKPASPAAEAL